MTGRKGTIGKMGGELVAKPDWKAIKTEYITTGISLRELAKKHGIGMSAVSNHSKAEGWVAQREKHQNKCVARSIQKAEAKEVNRLARLIDATTKAIDVAMEAFEDEQQFNRYIVSEGCGLGISETSEKIFSKVDTKALKDLTGVLKDLTGLMRDFYDIPTPAQAEAQRIAAARLELEKQKAKPDDTTDTTLEIVGIPEEYRR